METETSHKPHPAADPALAAEAAALARTLSVIILTYNEVHRLQPCLESVTWADEVIVVDGYSTDGTADLARRFTSHVYLSDLLGPERPGGYSDQRNFALARATGHWVLFLDADERVTPELRDELQARVLGADDEGHAAYRLLRLDFYFGIPWTETEDWQIRLVRRGAGSYNGRLVHEVLTYEGTLGDLSGLIHHYTKDTVSQYVGTINRYTSLEAEETVRTGQTMPASPWRGMGRAFLHWYFNHRSYRQGTFGLLMALMQSFYYFLMWAKYWEKRKNEGRPLGRNLPTPWAAALGGGIQGAWAALRRIKSLLRHREGSHAPKPFDRGRAAPR